MAFIATWLRLSSNKQLTWYRRSARQGKDIAHSQKVLAQRMADKVPSHYWREPLKTLFGVCVRFRGLWVSLCVGLIACA